MAAGSRCDARHPFAGRHVPTHHPWVLVSPSGRELHLCSIECMLTVVCTPAPFPEPMRPTRPTPRRPLLRCVR